MSSITVPLDRLEKVRFYWTTLGRFQGIVGLGGLVFVIWAIWNLTSLPVVVTVDGVSEQVFTHRRTLEPLLADLGLELHEQDQISHSLSSPLTRRLAVTIERTYPARIVADGRDLIVHSWATTPRDLLTDAGVGVDHYDQVLVNGLYVGLDDPLPERQRIALLPTYDRGYPWENLHIDPLRVTVYRAIDITVNDGNVPFVISTTAQSVGEALREAQITLYLGDKVQPSLGSPVSTGLRVYIERSTPVSLSVDGRLLKTRTRGKTVGDALTEIGVGVSGLDQVTPSLTTELYDHAAISIVRVREEIAIEEDIVPFETIFRGDMTILIDTQQMTQPGAEGITRRRYRVRYEDGQEVARVLEDTWIAQEPAQRVIAYGQKIEPRTFTTADGQTLTYWRKIRMRASSYSAATAGVSPTASYYGRTRTGDRMRFGIVAVDPAIVPLRSKVYVPGYGVGDALDTGSAIRAKHIDLGYDDNNLVLWSRWVDVYLLWPPPTGQITWVLPNWPVER
jgi:resuscitation-promoting factor RpfB